MFGLVFIPIEHYTPQGRTLGGSDCGIAGDEKEIHVSDCFAAYEKESGFDYSTS